MGEKKKGKKTKINLGFLAFLAKIRIYPENQTKTERINHFPRFATPTFNTTPVGCYSNAFLFIYVSVENVHLYFLFIDLEEQRTMHTARAGQKKYSRINKILQTESRLSLD